MLTRARATITGIVQGVGFRPFVYRLARENRLTGFVTNTPAGVLLEVQGNGDGVERFFLQVRRETPPLARITAVVKEEMAPTEENDFLIRESHGNAPRSALISPDVCVCDDCLRELRDPADRRYRYPFINCTNCGPRYTIIRDIPYDRPLTTMAGFAMCDECRREYEDPLDRRFHAQPNACPTCGPKLSFLSADGRPIDTPDPVRAAARELAAGRIVAVKGLGGFHLAVDAANDAAVARLRERKHREEKPLAVMAPDVETVEEFAQPTGPDIGALLSPERPIVILPARPGQTMVAPRVAPRSSTIGVMLPYTPLHFLLFDYAVPVLVMTSGNLSEEPIAIDNDEAVQRLGSIADFFLVHNRDIYLRSDDSVVRSLGGEIRPMRRSRGYVPVPVFLKRSIPSVLALGAELKNTVCLTKSDRAFVSQHVGDLENLETLSFFEQTIDHLKRILEIDPAVLAYDLHPRYLGTQYGREHENEYHAVVAVQHHHAHIASCMAEHGLGGEVIGLAMDGTGYGPDNTVWGGEVLKVSLTGFERLGHFATVPLPGGEAAIREPARMAVSYLSLAYGDEALNLDLAVLDRMGRNKAAALIEMMRNNVNCPLTSSCGRLFEAVSSLASIRDRNAYEGQAAIELEACGIGAMEEQPYPWRVERGEDGYIIRPESLIRAVVDDVLAGTPASIVSGRFHGAVMGAWEELCLALRDETGLERVVLSGGVFQNDILAERFPPLLERHGFEVYAHEIVPPNDACISLGQAVVAGTMAAEVLL